MNISIRLIFPSLINDFNLVFAKLKGRIGIFGVDITSNNVNTLFIRVIVEGDTIENINALIEKYQILFDDRLKPLLVWEKIVFEFKIKQNPPRPDTRKSDIFNVLQPGINIGDGFNQGTLGLICQEVINNEVCLLTAHHVLESEQVFQPFNNLESDFGELLDHDPTGDAAIAIFRSNIDFDTKIIDSNIQIIDVRYPKLNEKLIKVGLTTNKTSAIVKGIGVYKHIRVNEEIWVEGFWLIPENPNNPTDTEISFAGDSGAVWYSEVNSDSAFGVGLHIAGDRNDSPPFQEFAIAQNLLQIMQNLNLKLI